ncbi:MAG: acyltransferase [Rhodanobacteraceae bacterium]|nr:acyltransferase [Rhodanobacteraceae bacterium]
MLSFLPGVVILTLTSLLALTSTVILVPVLLVLALIKLLLPIAAVRRLLSRMIILVAETWIGINNLMIRLFTRDQRWEIEGKEHLKRDGWYLVLSNHQSWVDILVLQYVCNQRIPFLKFFIKSQLIWVPFLGLAWWALDFPFMKRYSKEHLEKHPELRGKDVEATRRACQRFAELPVSVMNFVEGTRFTPGKHERQKSPYRHLLKPKVGGVAFVLETMGETLRSIIDITIVYPDGRPTLTDLLSGRVRRVRIHVQRREIPRELLGGNYENDLAVRERFQQWINGIWAEKDRLIGSM